MRYGCYAYIYALVLLLHAVNLQISQFTMEDGKSEYASTIAEEMNAILINTFNAVVFAKLAFAFWHDEALN